VTIIIVHFIIHSSIFTVQSVISELCCVCVFSMQDDKPEQPVDKTEDVLFEVIDESANKEVGLELVPEDMNTVEDNTEGDEFADCVLEDVLLIDSEDGIDEDPIPSNESDKDLAKPTGMHILLWSPYVIGQTIIFSSCFFLLLLFFLA